MCSTRAIFHDAHNNPWCLYGAKEQQPPHSLRLDYQNVGAGWYIISHTLRGKHIIHKLCNMCLCVLCCVGSDVFYGRVPNVFIRFAVDGAHAIGRTLDLCVFLSILFRMKSTYTSLAGDIPQKHKQGRTIPYLYEDVLVAARISDDAAKWMSYTMLKINICFRKNQ